jgi:hypothetical protein
MEAYAVKQFVGMDLHRCRTVIVRTTYGPSYSVQRSLDDANGLRSHAEPIDRLQDAPSVDRVWAPRLGRPRSKASGPRLGRSLSVRATRAVCRAAWKYDRRPWSLVEVKIAD